MKYTIKLNGDRELALIDAGSETEALEIFSKVNVRHDENTPGGIEVKEEGHRFIYNYGGDTYSVSKQQIW